MTGMQFNTTIGGDWVQCGSEFIKLQSLPTALSCLLAIEPQ